MNKYSIVLGGEVVDEWNGFVNAVEYWVCHQGFAITVCSHSPLRINHPQWASEYHDQSLSRQQYYKTSILSGFPHHLLYLSSPLKLIDCQNKCSIVSHPAICRIFSKFRLDTLSYESSVASTKLKRNCTISHQMCNSISYCDWKERVVIKDYLLRCVSTRWEVLLVRNT